MGCADSTVLKNSSVSRHKLTNVIKKVYPECPICCGTDYPLQHFTAKCTHDTDTAWCSQCVTRHIDTELKGKLFADNLSCPICREPLSLADLRLTLSTKSFEQFEKLQLTKALEAMPEYRPCLNAGCGAGQLHSGTDPFVKCFKCKAVSCFEHRVPWHEGETCEQYSRRVTEAEKERERLSVGTIQRTTKACPKCNVRLEKSGGCDHFTCSICHTDFCWACGVTYDELRRLGQSAHKVDCQYRR